MGGLSFLCVVSVWFPAGLEKQRWLHPHVWHLSWERLEWFGADWLGFSLSSQSLTLPSSPLHGFQEVNPKAAGSLKD